MGGGSGGRQEGGREETELGLGDEPTIPAKQQIDENDNQKTFYLRKTPCNPKHPKPFEH